MDIFDGGGIPKYSTAQDIYDALCDLVRAEEMGILADIMGNAEDVSWDTQWYYYADKGSALKERFERLTDYGDKLWLIDLATFRADTDHGNIHDFVYYALTNEDLAKRLGFKKLFTEHMLCDAKDYARISEAFFEELSGLNRFDSYDMATAYKNATPDPNVDFGAAMRLYNKLTYALDAKVQGLKLADEMTLVAECRAHLTAYDDFIFGLRANQALYDEQKRMHGQRMYELATAYTDKLKKLWVAAERAGLAAAMTEELAAMGITAALPEGKP
jgi:hypothetical protein